MARYNPEQLMALALGQSMLVMAKAYGKQYTEGDWQNGEDFMSLTVRGYFSIRDVESLKQAGYVTAVIINRLGKTIAHIIL